MADSPEVLCGVKLESGFVLKVWVLVEEKEKRLFLIA